MHQLVPSRERPVSTRLHSVGPPLQRPLGGLADSPAGGHVDMQKSTSRSYRPAESPDVILLSDHDVLLRA